MKIKFRGKAVLSGGWKYGSCIRGGDEDDKYGYIQSYQREKFTYMVDKKSIGQFIGMKDIREIDIYTGDIVIRSSNYKISLINGSLIPDDVYEIGEVIYNVTKTRYEVLVRKQKELRYSGWIPYSRLLQFYDWKVIGNVTDNPEIFDGCEEGALKVDGSIELSINL